MALTLTLLHLHVIPAHKDAPLVLLFFNVKVVILVIFSNLSNLHILVLSCAINACWAGELPVVVHKHMAAHR